MLVAGSYIKALSSADEIAGYGGSIIPLDFSGENPFLIFCQIILIV